MIEYSKNLTYPCALVNEHTVRKSGRATRLESLEFMEALCSHLIKRPDPLIVPVYAFDVDKAEYNDYRYHYDMMRCGVLTDEERWIVDAVGDAASWRYSNPTRKFRESASVSVGGAHENYPQLMEFLEKITALGRYHDLHSGNVMRTPDADYCLIDLEGFTQTPLFIPANDWIIREQ